MRLAAMGTHHGLVFWSPCHVGVEETLQGRFARAQQRSKAMSATALTADEEIRRLRKLTEATHDLSKPCPRLTLHEEPPALAEQWTVVVRAITRCGQFLRSAARVPVTR
jgi:hypothetical protein